MEIKIRIHKEFSPIGLARPSEAAMAAYAPGSCPNVFLPFNFQDDTIRFTRLCSHELSNGYFREEKRTLEKICNCGSLFFHCLLLPNCSNNK